MKAKINTEVNNELCAEYSKKFGETFLFGSQGEVDLFELFRGTLIPLLFVLKEIGSSQEILKEIFNALIADVYQHDEKLFKFEEITNH
ncbi:MAG: hypothetical protein SFU99_12915 [Saprospiraceae bacterium]|nr:hypothetical protein [Saprospiraceae bacterium]